MPTRKKDNKKNLPQPSRDNATVPQKEETSKEKLKIAKTGKNDMAQVNAKAISGKKKKPKI